MLYYNSLSGILPPGIALSTGLPLAVPVAGRKLTPRSPEGYTEGAESVFPSDFE